MVRRGRSGSMGQGINRKILRQVMDSCPKDLATAEDIADDLRSRYRDFSGLTRQVLLRHVRQELNIRNNMRVKDDERDDNNGDVEGFTAQTKKQRRVDETEEKLQQRAEQVAIYSKQLSPQFDLTNDNLRGNYAKLNSSSKKPTGSPIEKNVEVETVSNKDRSKLATMGARKEANASISLSGTAGNGYLEVKYNKGPTFKDFGGIKNVLHQLERKVLFPILNTGWYKKFGVKPPNGILFHGPPGCGKTKLANAIANEAGVPFYKISATDVVSGVSGASEENIRELFSKAYRTTPSIVFIDEIDAIGSKRENQQREMEKRIVTQLLISMDGPGLKDDKSGPDSSDIGYVLVIGATNRPDALDPALRRGGRFDLEIALSPPDEDARADILSVLSQKLRLEGPFDKKRIARLTPGFVGADLESVVDLAGSIAMDRIIDSRIYERCGENEDDKSWLRLPLSEEDFEKHFVKMSDFEEAVNLVQPSLTREGFSIIPDVKWDDAGGLDHVRSELNRYLVRPIKNPDIYKAFRIGLQAGFLLYGPPGCGKTLIAKAAANEAGANFMHVKGAELLNKYVGESEQAIITLFQRARTCAPCVIFFDEVDALTTSRGKEGAWVVERLLNQFLVELDGGERRNVFVIGATNRPDVIDAAFLRHGRFGNLLYVPLPNADERASILKAIARKEPIDPNVDLDGIAKMKCEGFSGADLARLVQKAAFLAAEEMEEMRRRSEDGVIDASKCIIKMTHFEEALSLVSPSVSKKQRKYYEELSKKLEESVGRKRKASRKRWKEGTVVGSQSIGPTFA